MRIALKLKGVAYETVPVNLLAGEHRGAAYAAVNPHRRVPALRLDDGTVLSQSPAILEYLDEVYPNPPLLPTDAAARAKVRAAAALIACDIHPVNNSGVLAFLKDPLGQDQPAVDAWVRHWTATGLASIERLIEPGPFAFGSRPTLADLCIVPQLYNVRRFAVPRDSYTRLRSVEAACAELAAFRDARPASSPTPRLSNGSRPERTRCARGWMPAKPRSSTRPLRPSRAPPILARPGIGGRKRGPSPLARPERAVR